MDFPSDDDILNQDSSDNELSSLTPPRRGIVRPLPPSAERMNRQQLNRFQDMSWPITTTTTNNNSNNTLEEYGFKMKYTKDEYIDFINTFDIFKSNIINNGGRWVKHPNSSDTCFRYFCIECKANFKYQFKKSNELWEFKTQFI